MEIQYQQDDVFLQQFHYNKLQYQAVQQIRKQPIFKIKRFKNIAKSKIGGIKKKKDISLLKKTVLKAKVNLLAKNFIRKSKRSIIYKQTPSYINLQKQQQNINFIAFIIKFLQNTQGLLLKPITLCIWSFINIIQISIMVIIFSIMMTFPQTDNLQSFQIARYFSLILYFIDMILNFTTQKNQIDGNKKKLKDIIISYIKNQFCPDFFSIAIFPLSNIIEASSITPLILLIALFKLKNNLKRFQNYEFIYIKTNSREKYYNLFKVILFNFTIGHLLSILLNLMAKLSPSNQNWHSKLNLDENGWWSKYIWGYYWGTNIMLTVGFGDLCASNQTQATILIFIQTISCITLAYNISCVGSIIGQINAENQQKKKKLKYFHRMCEENKITEELQHKIKNMIEQSYLIKQQFQFEQYEDVMNSLPKSIQSQYRKQANRQLFTVGFFNSLKMKTILNLAQYIIRKVAHPQQIIQKKGQIQRFCILQKGCIGLACRNGAKSLLNGTLIQKYQILKHQNAKILSLNFIKRKMLKYDIKSIFYSVYYYLTCEQLMKILQQCEIDYQFFHYIRQKDDNIIGCNQIYKCKICKDDYHTLFQCPSYHYIPLKQLIILNYLQKAHNFINKRHKFKRNQKFYKNYRSLYGYQVQMEEHQKYLREIYDLNQIKQIRKLIKIHQKINNVTSKQPCEKQQYQKRVNILERHFNIIQSLIAKNQASLQQTFWLVQCDNAFSFKHFFKQYNPCRLNKFSMYSHKFKSREQAFGTYAHRKLPYNPAMNQVTKSVFEDLFVNNNLNQETNFELLQFTNKKTLTNNNDKISTENYFKTLTDNHQNYKIINFNFNEQFNEQLKNIMSKN